MLEDAIQQALQADDDITAFVGDRVRPLRVAPDDVLPYITYQITGGGTFPTLSDGPGDWLKGQFEIGIFAEDYAGAMDLSNLVRKYLDDLTITIAGVEMDVMFDDETDQEEGPAAGDESPSYMRVQPYRCLYRLTT